MEVSTEAGKEVGAESEEGRDHRALERAEGIEGCSPDILGLV